MAPSGHHDMGRCTTGRVAVFLVRRALLILPNHTLFRWRRHPEPEVGQEGTWLTCGRALNPRHPGR
jgi:hypothetical protein